MERRTAATAESPSSGAAPIGQRPGDGSRHCGESPEPDGVESDFGLVPFVPSPGARPRDRSSGQDAIGRRPGYTYQPGAPPAPSAPVSSRMSDALTNASPAPPLDFIRQIVSDDLAAGRHDGRVHTRFPPEPNGYLHIGHAKAICLNFGIAAGVRRACATCASTTPTPTKEDVGVRRLDPGGRALAGLRLGGPRCSTPPTTSSSCTTAPSQLIREGKAYVCSLSADEIREYRGTLTEPGTDSPYRDRPVEENLDLFAAHARGRVPRRHARRCAPRSTWPRPT